MTIYKKLHFSIASLLIFCFSIGGVCADSIPDRYVISLLTCGTGTSEVYQAYGHTGIRVIDRETNRDDVYNYGMFNFNEDGFIMKFIQGKLLYFVAKENFQSFMYDYYAYGRSVREQTLQLTPQQEKQLVTALENNILPENRYYLYDFIYNNCSTQPRDLLLKALGEDFRLQALSNDNTETIRQMVDRHMCYNEWLDLGIDLLLGVRFDKVADASTRMFLPAELMMRFDSTTFHGHPIVKDSRMLYQGTEQVIPCLLDPTLAFWLLLGFVLLLQILHRGTTWKKALSLFILTVVGLIGWILTFMWVGTDHYMTKWNYNLLLAIPMHLPLALFCWNAYRSQFLKNYLQVVRILQIVFLIAWCCWPQQFHTAIIPIVLLHIWSLGVLRERLG